MNFVILKSIEHRKIYLNLISFPPLLVQPLYFMELAVGQFSSSGSVKVWKMVPAVKGGIWTFISVLCK